MKNLFSKAIKAALSTGVQSKLLSTVTRDDALMHQEGKLVAMLYRDGGEYCIVTDSEFNKLSLSTQAFVLLHEVGHFMTNPFFGNGLSLKDENNADKFALSALGHNTVLNAMNELYISIAPISIIGAAEIGVRMEMLGFDISNMWMNTPLGVLTGDQFKLVFSNPEAITFR